MDVSGVSNSVIDSVVNTASREAPGAVKALGKAQDIQKETAQQLIESVPEPKQADSDSRVGQNVDVRA